MTPIEDAQIRVARAEDGKRKLQEEVIERFGSIETMKSYAQNAGPGGRKAAELRRRYNRAVRELKLAKQDLARLRGEGPKPQEDEAGPEGKKDGIQPTAASGGKRGEPEDHGTLEVARKASEGCAVIDRPSQISAYIKVVNDGFTTTEVVGERRDGRGDAAEARREAKQLDLNGEELKLPPGVRETRKVTRSRTYEIGKFKLSIKEEDLQTFTTIGGMGQRKLVAARLRVLPNEDIFEGDFDDGVDEMIKVLCRASIILKSEMLKAAMTAQRPAGVTG